MPGWKARARAILPSGQADESKQKSTEMRWVWLVRRMFQRFMADGCLDSAAALTYTTLFAVVPLMTVTYSILAGIPSFQEAGGQVQNFIFQNFVPATGEVVQSYLQDFSQQARKLTAVGVAFLVITAFMMLRTVDTALNRIWAASHGRRRVNTFLLYWAILTLGPILLGLGFALSSYLTSLKLYADAASLIGGEKFLLRMAPLVLSITTFTLIYITVPNRKVEFRHAITGAVFVGILFELAKAGFAWFVTNSPTYELVYGAFAAVPVFLLWIWISWVVVLLGAELVRCLGLYRQDMPPDDLPDMVALLAILSVFRQRFRQGLHTGYRHVVEDGWALHQRHWEELIAQLLKQQILEYSEKGELMLARDLSSVSMMDLCEQLKLVLPDETVMAAFPEVRAKWLAQLQQSVASTRQHQCQVMVGSLADWVEP
ncbi:virulence factor BrkB family protein [Endozoicomonadaceae bacterium StTr2]